MSSSSHWKLTCSHHDIAETFLSWRWTTITHSWNFIICYTNCIKQLGLGLFIIHVIELLCYNWRFANFWLEIWSHNWRFFIDVFDACFYCLLMFSFCLFRIEPTASHFNIYCLHFCLISSVSYDEWRIKTVFIIYS